MSVRQRITRLEQGECTQGRAAVLVWLYDPDNPDMVTGPNGQRIGIGKIPSGACALLPEISSGERSRPLVLQVKTGEAGELIESKFQ